LISVRIYVLKQEREGRGGGGWRVKENLEWEPGGEKN